MKIATSYISKTVITYTMLVMLFLFGLQIFVEFMHEFPSLGEGNYGLHKVLIYVLLMLPYDMYQFFPMACLLGSVIGLGLLSSNSELIVMRSSGMSLVSIASSVIKAATVLIIFMLLIGEVLSPVAQSKAARMKTKAISGGKVLMTKHGVWLYNGGDFINIDTVSSDGNLNGVVRYQLDDELKLKSISRAKTGLYKKEGWVFNNVEATDFKGDRVVSSFSSSKNWLLTFSPKLIGATHIDSDQKSLIALGSYIKNRAHSGLETFTYEFNFWKRVFSPFATLVMILLAVPFVFGQLRSSTTGFRMFIGIMLGFVFYTLNQFAGPMTSVYQVSPMLAAVAPIFIFTAFGCFLLLRIR